MRKFLIIALAGFALSSAALTSPVFSESIPNAGKRDTRVRFVNYIENDVVKVDASYGASTMIVFQDDEKVGFLSEKWSAGCCQYYFFDPVSGFPDQALKNS